MKIILLTPGTGSYYCGVCMRDNALAKELIRQGHDAMMLPLYLPLQLDETPATEGVPTFFGGVNVYLQQQFSLFRYTPKWLDRLLDRPGLLQEIGRRQHLGSKESMGQITCSMFEGELGRQRKELRKLIEWLQEHGKPDAIWLSTALLAGLAREIKRELGLPVIASLQGEDDFIDSLPKNWKLRAWELFTERARDVDLFIAPSRYYAKVMGGRLRLRPEQLRVIPNGLATDGFGEPAPPPDPPVVGYLARMVPQKGLGLVVQAFVMLKKRPGFELVKLKIAGAMTAGDEEYVAKLKKDLAKAGCEKDAEFLPNIDRAEKIAFLKGLTLLSVPALYPEAFGLYLVEAWAAGVPVVQPRHASFTELIESTGAGRLFSAEDADDMVSEWSPLLADPALARETGRRGREAVLHGDFSLPRMAERYLAATREVLSAAPVAP